MIVVGVDGGTTKTIAIAADESGRVFGAARGGGSNWAGEDVTIPMEVVAETVRSAFSRAGLSGEKAVVGVFTLAGADWPEDHSRRELELGKAGICSRVIVKNDSFGGLRAGTDKPYGMVIAAGTGVNAAVITPDGQEWAFGYYETFGGAGTLAQHAFEAVLRAEDGRGEPTALTEKSLALLGFDCVESMLRAYILRKIEKRRLLGLCPLVFEAAQQGDQVSVEIIVRQGRGLAEYAQAMVRRFRLQDLEFDLVLAGSVFKGVGPLLVDTITQEVHRAAPRANVVRAKAEPVVGSVLLAYDALGIPVTAEMRSNLALTMPGTQFFDTTGGDGYRPAKVDGG